MRYLVIALAIRDVDCFRYNRSLDCFSYPSWLKGPRLSPLFRIWGCLLYDKYVSLPLRETFLASIGCLRYMRSLLPSVGRFDYKTVIMFDMWDYYYLCYFVTISLECFWPSYYECLEIEKWCFHYIECFLLQLCWIYCLSLSSLLWSLGHLYFVGSRSPPL